MNQSTTSELSNSEFSLTEGEISFIHKFLSSNTCGAETPEDLINDNHSCQCIEDLYEHFPNLTHNQVGGYLSSLQEKNVLVLEDRDGPICKSKNRVKQMQFEPDLYWVNEYYLKSLPSELRFY